VSAAYHGLWSVTRPLKLVNTRRTSHAHARHQHPLLYLRLLRTLC